MINIQQGMSPQLYMSMDGLNNLINNKVQQQQRTTSTTMTASYNHQVNSTYPFHIIVIHQYIHSYNNSSIKVNHDKQS